MQPASRKLESLSREAVEELSWLKNEPDWLRERRLRAWTAWERLPMPSKEEEWRRTDISALDLSGIVPFAEGSGPASDLNRLPAELRAEPGAEAGFLVQVDSESVYETLVPELEKQGVIFCSLDRAVRDYPDLVRDYLLTRNILPDERKFIALHSAFWSGGSFLFVPDGVAVEIPLRSVYWLSRPEVGAFPHTLVVLGRGAQVTYLEEFASPGFEAGGFSASAHEFFLQEGAQLRYVTIQNWGPTVWHFGTERMRLDRDARVNSLVIGVGSRLARSEVECYLEGVGAESEMLGLYLGADRQHLAFHTLQRHLARHTVSDLLYKGALRDRAHALYMGLIQVLRSAQQSDAYQANRNLILGGRARADSIPMLEIEANDVRCTHGSTTGKVDEDQLFYLMSRGLSRAEATAMIIEGFFEPLLARIPLEQVRTRITRFIREKLVYGGEGR